MEASAASILFVDQGDALFEARALLARQGVQTEAVVFDPTADGKAICPGAPAVVVIGPAVPNPAGVARRISAAHPAVHLVFVAASANQEALRRGLLYSAPANTPWQLVRAERDEIAAAAASALEAARRGRQVRTTLDRVNVQLAAPTADPQAYRRLVVSDQYLASVLKHIEDAIVSLDLQGNILSWNDGATRLFGRKVREATGESLQNVAAWSGPLQGLLAAAVREGHVRSELHFVVKGRAVIVDATFTAIEAHRSEVLAVAAILRDITERKRTEAELATNEARFRALADNIPQLAWMTDATGAIFWYNRRWFDYTGTTLEQMRGWGWQAVHHPEHLERVLRKFKGHIDSGVEWEDTFPLRSKQGAFRWFLSRAFPIRDAVGRITNWFGTNTDITAERDAREALLEADRRKNDFISVLSHELRNPLAPIRNSVHVLDRVAPDAVAALKAREVIRRQTDHLARLVDDLLDVTRISRGKMSLATALGDLVAAVRETVEDYRPLVESRGLALGLATPEGPAYAQFDVVRIGQVLGNLLQNALKFTPEGGRIDVVMAIVAGFARIDVRDSGMGIDADLMKVLFEPFVQGERSLARSQGGLGLGLALGRGVAEMHGGRLEASSEGVDNGAQFTLWLPVLAG